MRYPTVTFKTCTTLVQEFLEGGASRVLTEDEVVYAGNGPQLDLTDLELLAATTEERRASFLDSSEGADKDLFEGRVSGELHAALRDVDTAVLDDPGFWRYVALQHFWPLTYWREQQTFDKAEPRLYLKYVDGRNPTECVVTRMFLRAAAVRQGDDYSLAAGVPKGTDFWRSHVLRVSVAYAPPVARAFARQQIRSRMPTSELRPYARRLNRLSTNLVLAMQNDEDAEAIISGLRNENGHDE